MELLVHLAPVFFLVSALSAMCVSAQFAWVGRWSTLPCMGVSVSFAPVRLFHGSFSLILVGVPFYSLSYRGEVATRGWILLALARFICGLS